MNLKAKMIDHAKRVLDQSTDLKDESAIKQVAVLPFIQALGFDTANIREVEPEFNADPRETKGGEKVDYALKRDGLPVVFVEVKHATSGLTKVHWKQLHNYYNAVTQVKLAILTNGIEYRFYTEDQAPNIMDKEPFLALNLEKLDQRMINELERIIESVYHRNQIQKSARILKLIPELKSELDEPTDDFVNYLAKRQYPDSEQTPSVRQYKPIVKTALSEVTASGRQGERSHDVEMLLGNCLIPVPIRAHTQGKDEEAWFLLGRSMPKRNERRVLYNSRKVTPTTAAQMAKGSNKGGNGWGFWKVVDPTDGNQRPIGDLRFDDGLVSRLVDKYAE